MRDQIKTEDLYTVADVKRVRELLTVEQGNCCAITGLEIPVKQHCLDHVHDTTQYVRGVAHRQGNAALGKIENLYVRYLSYWYPDTLSTFLRQCAEYLEKAPDSRYRHNGWIKVVKVAFNKLKASEQDLVLTSLGYEKGSNLKDRKAKFAKLVLDRNLGYDTITKKIKEVKVDH